jgi:hypothetical protein
MVGNTPDLTTPVLNTSTAAITVPGKIIYVPLEFWFNRNPGLKSIELGHKSVVINQQC